jgi:membrane protease YdiL (CAAX protease family)
MGLTLGRPRITLWWTLVPVAALLLLVAGALLLIPLLIRGLGMTGLLDLLVATDATVAYVPWRSVLWYCIFTPIYEEILYRGMAYPALATALGRERALLACGVVWMLLHLAYGWDAWRMPYYFVTGVLFTWMFARSGSLVPSFVLHAVGNLIAPVLMDYLLGKDPGLFRRLVAGL